MTDRPRRSCLYMPGANPKALEKAKTLPADALIFDLEDAVAPEAKETAREAVAAALAGGGYGKREIIVRVNALSTPWGAADVAAVAKVRPQGVLFPKIETAADVFAADSALTAAGADAGLKLFVMIETPAAILEIAAIAAAQKMTRLAGFVMGTNDLVKDLRARARPDRLPMHTALALTVAAARRHGLAVIDGVYNDIANEAGFAEECAQGRDFGFDGKTLIHPTQVEPANRIFAPEAEEIAQARAVIEAFAAPENAGKGVLKVNGKMTELLHLAQATRTVAVADMIAALAE